jgi:hypothetical protein
MTDHRFWVDASSRLSHKVTGRLGVYHHRPEAKDAQHAAAFGRDRRLRRAIADGCKAA